MRVLPLSLLLIFVLRASALRTKVESTLQSTQNADICSTVEAETVTEQVPSVLVEETETTPEITVAPAYVGGETIIAYLPQTEEISEEAPVVVVETSEEESFVVQVIEAYESETGESQVVVNLGEGETVTIEAEVVETETPLAVVTSEGEVSVVEVVESYEAEGESYVVITTSEGETETVEAQVVTELTTEVSDTLVQNEEEPAFCS
jgi:hypothetical protein